MECRFRGSWPSLWCSSAGTAAGCCSASASPTVGWATWWLLGLTLIWLGAVVVSPEFVWLAFPLWLLAGFVMRLRWALLLSVAILAVVVSAPLLHTGATTYANVIGPLVGGIFALGISADTSSSSVTGGSGVG